MAGRRAIQQDNAETWVQPQRCENVPCRCGHGRHSHLHDDGQCSECECRKAMRIEDGE